MKRRRLSTLPSLPLLVNEVQGCTGQAAGHTHTARNQAQVTKGSTQLGRLLQVQLCWAVRGQGGDDWQPGGHLTAAL